MLAAHTNQNLILADIQLVEQCRDSKEGKQETLIKFQIFIFYSAFDALLPTKMQFYFSKATSPHVSRLRFSRQASEHNYCKEVKMNS